MSDIKRFSTKVAAETNSALGPFFKGSKQVKAVEMNQYRLACSKKTKRQRFKLAMRFARNFL